MQKRFKSKKRYNKKFLSILFVLITILVSFYISYNVIYVQYLSNLSNKDIINHIIDNNISSSSSFLDIYKNPNIILNNNFNIIDKETIEVDNSNVDPLVYIYSTHETESYQDSYLELYNIKPTVKIVSYILKDYLEDYGINTIVENKSVTDILKNNKWSYKYSYEASRIAIEDVIKSNSSLKLVIDLHRDSSNLSKTLLEVDGTKYARILFVVGGENINYQENLNIANRLKSYLEEEITNITRGVITKSGVGVNGVYNQDLSTKSVLIELGGQYNEIEETNNTLKVLSKSILRYIEGD